MDDAVYDQITNVATLPGIVKYAPLYAGRALRLRVPYRGRGRNGREKGGVISPGGIGFDINCGMRLIKTDLTYDEVQPRLTELVDKLFAAVPAGVGSTGFLKLSRQEFRTVLEQGAQWCVRNGYGWNEDLELTEDSGRTPGADASKVSERAIDRGFNQIGTLGSGNHYLEIQVVREENICDKDLAQGFGLAPGQIVVMFHCGSRGFGHQVATDYLQLFLKVMESKYHIRIPDRELACAPFDSPEGRDYFAAMKCALNMSFANRQMILHRVREVFSRVYGRSAEKLGIRMIYDISHNTAKLERHTGEREGEVSPRPQEGGDQGLRAGNGGDTRALPKNRPARHHRGEHGNGLVSARGHRRRQRDVFQHASRKRPHDEPHEGAQRVAGKRAAG